ncbi:diguanylate cyclase (GGDEF) domain-containing protein [Asanoa hainanensis]|uniref:Diguanylate cyclase (GGDEF) domain-containing protein n=1 Tax=Asanoa hainanensis TaxID=560556 RepID=A0A239PER0_9ACTN|nr:bifunctional diguanylate cyclase/phosphodiesterase [Asanoa hainanensis]SNT65501.1 diguanylate cyclase (GGDEF) domain-containing protein [Asanoa hainanensis]
MTTLQAGFWILAAIAIASDLRPVAEWDRRHPGSAVFLSICFSFGILLIWGLAPAVVVQATANVLGCARSRVPVRDATLVVVRNCGGLAAAAGVLRLTGVGPLRRAEGVDGSTVGQVVLAVAAALVVSYGILIVADRITTGRPWRTTFNRGLGLNVLASTSLLFLGPVIVAEPRGWTFALLLLPIGALNELVHLVDRQTRALRQDALTGVLSQRGLEGVVARLLGRDEERSRPTEFAFLLFHGSRLRTISESYGRRISDRILVEVSNRLRETLGPGDEIGRLEGNEFGIVLAGHREPDAAVAAARRMVGALDRPALVDGVPFDIRGAAGVVLAPAHGEDLATIVRHADAAAHRAAGSGVGVLAYAPTPVSDPARRLALLRDLNAALANQPEGGTIRFVYQPQVDVATGDLASVEALLRWQHPVRGTMDTGALVEVAEPTALMAQITERAVADVTAQVRRWRDEGRSVTAAVNISMRDLHTTAFVDHLVRTVGDAGIGPGQLTVEVTEGELILDEASVEQAVARIRDAGIGLSLDDFGTGFSSLQHLRRLPLTEVKIDRSLVRGIVRRGDDRALVRSVIEMGRALGLRVVAEGVEDDQTHQVLADLGCPVAQGWLYGRPMPAAEISERVRARNS